MTKKDLLFINDNNIRLEMTDGSKKEFNKIVKTKLHRKFDSKKFKVFDDNVLPVIIGDDNVLRKADDLIEITAERLASELEDHISDDQLKLIVSERPLLLVIMYTDLTLFVELLNDNEIEFVYTTANLQTIIS